MKVAPPPILVLLLSAPTQPLAYHGYLTAAALKRAGVAFRVFFYQDAVSIANGLNWRPQDQANLTQLWAGLGIDLPVCVSAALQRGITDEENAQRHQLSSHNLASGFRLCGLGQLAESLAECKHVVQF